MKTPGLFCTIALREAFLGFERRYRRLFIVNRNVIAHMGDPCWNLIENRCFRKHIKILPLWYISWEGGLGRLTSYTNGFTSCYPCQINKKRTYDGSRSFMTSDLYMNTCNLKLWKENLQEFWELIESIAKGNQQWT